eukprot:1264844-Rhodomonas_salina.1
MTDPVGLFTAAPPPAPTDTSRLGRVAIFVLSAFVEKSSQMNAILRNTKHTCVYTRDLQPKLGKD